MKRKNLIWLIVVLLILVIAIVWFFAARNQRELRLVTRDVAEGTVEVTVMATGYVQPVDQVEVGTQVSGVIEKIYVDFNSQVRKGQLIAELDKSTLSERVSQAQATLTRAQSDLTYARQNYDRTRQLYESKAATQVALEQAVNSLAQAETSVTDAEANLHQARVNISYADILSPIDGIVLDRAVEEGQTVAASFNTPTLFTIANDLTNMQVEADVDEADIGRVKLGQKVLFSVDAYPDIEFEGEVNQLRLQPVVTNNVVTYTVIISAPNPDEKLLPGMTANISIVTDSETGMVIPVEATAFRMDTDVMQALGITPEEVLPGGRGQRQTSIWVRNNGSVEARCITTGINDGVSVIVESGLNPGEEVVLSASYEKMSRNNGDAVANPLVPQGPRRR